MDHVELTEARIEVGRVTSLVSSPVCGATSVFIGTTRDNFEGKKVLRLEYEAYAAMAEKKMQEICDQIHEMWNVEKVAIVHRIGVVPIEEASIVIAVSSAHRKESLEAVQYGIDTLKATVPIWKKEVYDDDTSAWKENKECCAKRRADTS